MIRNEWVLLEHRKSPIRIGLIRRGALTVSFHLFVRPVIRKWTQRYETWARTKTPFSWCTLTCVGASGVVSAMNNRGWTPAIRSEEISEEKRRVAGKCAIGRRESLPGSLEVLNVCRSRAA